MMMFTKRSKSDANDAIYRVEHHETYVNTIFGLTRRPTLTVVVIHERSDDMPEPEAQQYWRKAERIARRYKRALFGLRRAELNWLMRSPSDDAKQPPLGQPTDVPYDIVCSI